MEGNLCPPVLQLRLKYLLIKSYISALLTHKSNNNKAAVLLLTKQGRCKESKKIEVLPQFVTYSKERFE